MLRKLTRQQKAIIPKAEYWIVSNWFKVILDLSTKWRMQPVTKKAKTLRSKVKKTMPTILEVNILVMNNCRNVNTSMAE
jgi:hypothetical protein